MATYIEYELDDGTKLLIESNDAAETSGLVKAGRDESGNVIIRATKKFGDALEIIRAQAVALRQKLEDARADEVEVKFSLKATGGLGSFAIASLNAEAAYEITLKWKNLDESAR